MTPRPAEVPDELVMVVTADAATAARRAAEHLAERLLRAVAARGRAAMAVSGGSTAPAVFAALAARRLPWEHVGLWQVDERLVPDGHTARNAEQLAVLPVSAHHVHRMPVTEHDLGRARARYERALPERFDVVHLGVGEDGHTASWPPGDRGVLVSNRGVELVGEYAGFRRMTLTPRVVNAARGRIVVAVGAAKAPAIERWRRGDRAVPVSALRHRDTVLVTDVDAAGASDPGVTGQE